jgi:hypothetical protein
MTKFFFYLQTNGEYIFFFVDTLVSHIVTSDSMIRKLDKIALTKVIKQR